MPSKCWECTCFFNVWLNFVALSRYSSVGDMQFLIEGHGNQFYALVTTLTLQCCRRFPLGTLYPTTSSFHYASFYQIFLLVLEFHVNGMIECTLLFSLNIARFKINACFYMYRYQFIKKMLSNISFYEYITVC